MGKKDNKVVGREGERLAGEYLMIKGYKILHKNYQSKWGEVDIIAKFQIPNNKFQKEEVVVFVEVKTKSGTGYGEPWEMVNHWKIEQVKTMGEAWCQEFGWEGRVRVDVVGVWLNGDEPRVKHWESVEI